MAIENRKAEEMREEERGGEGKIKGKERRGKERCRGEWRGDRKQR